MIHYITSVGKTQKDSIKSPLFGSRSLGSSAQYKTNIRGPVACVINTNRAVSGK